GRSGLARPRRGRETRGVIGKDSCVGWIFSDCWGDKLVGRGSDRAGSKVLTVVRASRVARPWYDWDFAEPFQRRTCRIGPEPAAAMPKWPAGFFPGRERHDSGRGSTHPGECCPFGRGRVWCTK